MKKFEYLIGCRDDLEKYEGGLETAFNQLGRDGWELVAAEGRNLFYFKRELILDAPQSPSEVEVGKLCASKHGELADHKQNPYAEADFDQHYRDLEKDEKAAGLTVYRGGASVRALRRMYFAGRIDGTRLVNSTQGPG